MTTLTITQTIAILDGISDHRFLTKAVWEAIGEGLLISIRERFDQEISPDGNKFSKPPVRRFTRLFLWSGRSWKIYS